MKRGLPVEGVGAGGGARHQGGGEDPGDQHGRLADRIVDPRGDQFAAPATASRSPARWSPIPTCQHWAAGRGAAASALHLLQPLPRSTRRRTRWAATSRCASPSHDAMVEELMTIYRAHPTLRVPEPGGDLTDEPRSAGHRRPGGAPPPLGMRRLPLYLLLALIFLVGIVGTVARHRRSSGSFRSNARRTTPTSSSISNTARSAPSRTAASPTASGGRCRPLSRGVPGPRRLLRLRLPLRERRRRQAARPADRHRRGAIYRASTSSGSIARPATPAP